MLERFPFLHRYILTEADVWVEPIEASLANIQSKRWSGYAEEGGFITHDRDIFILNEAGEELCVVGKIPKKLSTKKFWGFTIRREKVVIRKVSETIQEALNRVEGAHYVLVRKCHSNNGEEVVLYLPPDGQTAKECLTQMLEKARLEEELRIRKIEEERHIASQ